MSRITYRAPKPSYTWKEWFSYVRPRLLIAPLAWDICKGIANFFLGRAVGSLVLPAQDVPEDKWPKKWHKMSEGEVQRLDGLYQGEFTHQRYAVKTHDGETLETLEIIPEGAPKPADSSYVINFNGNGECFEGVLETMRGDAKALKARVIGFNFRGVRGSTGRASSKDQLVIDGIAQVQRLLDAGVKPKKITLKGHSLGGGISALVAQHFHRQGIRIKVFNSRSFSSLTKVVVGHVVSGDKQSIGKIILGGVLKFLLSLFNWEINAGDAFKEVPKTHRDYLVVRSGSGKKAEQERESERFVDYKADRAAIDDRVIPHYASIHESLKDERQRDKRRLDGEIERAERDGHDKLAQKLREERLQYKRHKMVATVGHYREEDDRFVYADGHNLRWTQLTSRVRNESSGEYRDVTGEDYFRDFARRDVSPSPAMM